MFDHGFVERSKLTYNYVRSLSHPLIKPGVYCHPGHRQGRQNPRQCQRRLDKGSESGRQGWQDCGIQSGDEGDLRSARLGLSAWPQQRPDSWPVQAGIPLNSPRICAAAQQRRGEFYYLLSLDFVWLYYIKMFFMGGRIQWNSMQIPDNRLPVLSRLHFNFSFE